MKKDNKFFGVMVVSVLVILGGGVLFLNNSLGIFPKINNYVTDVFRLRSRGGSTGMTYEDALNAFSDGYRIQVNNCSAQPPRITVKNGSQIMLDNRSAQSAQIQLGGKSYNLAAYDFRLVTVSAAKLPQTLQMDCRVGSKIGKNIAQVTLQK